LRMHTQQPSNTFQVSSLSVALRGLSQSSTLLCLRFCYCQSPFSSLFHLGPGQSDYRKTENWNREIGTFPITLFTGTWVRVSAQVLGQPRSGASNFFST